MIMPPFVTGLLFGLVFIFSLGPGFFALVQTSVQKGFKRAVFLAVGISLSDILYVALSIMGVARLLEEPHARLWMAAISMVILLVYGVYSWFKKPKIYQQDDVNAEFSIFKYIFKGFILNGLNPFIVIFWVSIISLVSVKYNFNFIQQVTFFAGVLTTIFSSDLLKAFIAYRLRSMVTPQNIVILNRSVGVILILFGIYFLVDSYMMG